MPIIKEMWKDQANEYLKIFPKVNRVSFVSYKDGHILFEVIRCQT